MKNNNFMVWLLAGVIMLSVTIVMDSPKRKIRYVADFNGEWEAGTTESMYNLKLEQTGDQILGSHCFILESGAKSDCDPSKKTIVGTVSGNEAKVKMVSSFATEPITVNLKMENSKIIFETGEIGETVPKSMILDKFSETNRPLPD